MAAVLALAMLLVIALGVGGVSGRLTPYELYTHCGIRYADFGGTRYYADPPQDDGNGNPPGGWGNPTDSGWLVVLDSSSIAFLDWTGHHASFSTHPHTGVPQVQLCS